MHLLKVKLKAKAFWKSTNRLPWHWPFRLIRKTFSKLCKALRTVYNSRRSAFVFRLRSLRDCSADCWSLSEFLTITRNFCFKQDPNRFVDWHFERLKSTFFSTNCIDSPQFILKVSIYRSYKFLNGSFCICTAIMRPLLQREHRDCITGLYQSRNPLLLKSLIHLEFLNPNQFGQKIWVSQEKMNYCRWWKCCNWKPGMVLFEQSEIKKLSNFETFCVFTDCLLRVFFKLLKY